MQFVTIMVILGTLMAVLCGVSLARSRSVTLPEGLPPLPEDAPAVARLKQLVEARLWRAALPSLLVIGGVFGVMVVGSLALALVFDQLAAALVTAGVALYAIGRFALDYRRA